MDVKNYEAICSGIRIRKKYESVLRRLKLEKHLPAVTRNDYKNNLNSRLKKLLAQRVITSGATRGQWISGYKASLVSMSSLPKPLFLKVWSTDQQHKHHLRAYWKGSVSGLIPGLLNQLCILMRLLLNSYAHSVQFSCSVVSNSATPWAAARQTSLSITNSWSLFTFMPIELVKPSNHLFLSSPSSGFNLSLPQGLFQWVSSSHQVAKVLELQLRHQSFQRTFRVDFL